jgi:hypothetical protein
MERTGGLGWSFALRNGWMERVTLLPPTANPFDILRRTMNYLVLNSNSIS